MRGLITGRHEPRLSSLPGVSVCSDRGNTGTHPNTHCCHAVLDVLFICWIPAQSCSHAFPRAECAESPTKLVASFFPAYEYACHTPAHPRFLSAACRFLGSGPSPRLPFFFFFCLWIAFWGSFFFFLPFFSLSTPLCIPPARL